jgi:hypothetical protein
LQVDVNGDGGMEWHEFISFVIEMGASAKEKAQTADTISSYHPANVLDTQVGRRRPVCKPARRRRSVRRHASVVIDRASGTAAGWE